MSSNEIFESADQVRLIAAQSLGYGYSDEAITAPDRAGWFGSVTHLAAVTQTDSFTYTAFEPRDDDALTAAREKLSLIIDQFDKMETLSPE